MRARHMTNGQIDAIQPNYRLFDSEFADAAPTFSSGTPWFAFETIDFDFGIDSTPAIRTLQRQADSRSASAVLPSDFALAPIDQAIAFAPSGVRSLLSGQFEGRALVESDIAAELSIDVSQSIIASAASIASATEATAVASDGSGIAPRIFSGPIDIPEGAAIEAGFSMLDLINFAPVAALNQGDTFYMFDNVENFSLARIATAPDSFFDIGRDPFELSSYLTGDIDNDGVNDYVIRIDKGGPTLLGTDFGI